MNRDEVLSLFREAGAILEGHFILTSGLRSPVFLQKARVFMYPDKTEKLCKALADKIRDAGLDDVDYIISPALGGLIPGYETARHLGVPAMWVEREDGEFRLRRFDLPKGARVIVVEDIVTTGLSSRETVTSLKALGAEVLGVACLIDRSGGEADASVPIIALAEYKVPAYEPDNLPPELAALPAIKPGSRGLS
ncbi:MAG: orotate phosphoribosyltransferase [Roseibium album]|uniref:Orotate phosphoribosyltransferase n=1 Tax=Roseibium album TaxID=311410 RepID=A0A0M7AKH3_9HYPH|nr:orotate phosphoribosyltransferase [Roseibium album]MBG6155444.1 orotate phosphoribosyltransferase [Labrenzia sp. EL_162]MBG6160902.1 orotate phosphoribosyltransferase [Labrenzia sp. EL_195]MBG6176119.1 orotate phosphoribosyltransferase [Labrenzia sp. EL_132]MBG6193979.1 orotate phosphoribosyltransferase [Labrenzia sp. EL_159]MBG6230734.1 orotate phosphoribosyltransferase [Labrenzia sp. EL_208]MCR9059561.1 orotate phosphoribosyltransferase [Paracoccaceae bacterium]